MDAHLPELAEEVAEVLLVGRLGRKLAQRQRHRLRIGPEHGGPLLGGRIAAEQFAGDLQHQPVPDRLADAGDRGAIGLRVEAMAPFRVAHMQVDHRGAALEAFGGRAGEFVGGQRQRGMVGLGLAPAIGRNRQHNPSARFGQGHRIPPFRRSPRARRLGRTRPSNNSPLLSVMTHILHRAANVEHAGRGFRFRRRDRRRRGPALSRRVGRRGCLVPRPRPSRRARRHARASSTRWPTRIRRFFTTEAAERLADRLIEDAPPGLSHVYLVSGGSEAIEAALKMARQYFVEIGEPQRAPCHRAAPELSRQYAGRARGRRQRLRGARNSSRS